LSSCFHRQLNESNRNIFWLHWCRIFALLRPEVWINLALKDNSQVKVWDYCRTRVDWVDLSYFNWCLQSKYACLYMLLQRKLCSRYGSKHQHNQTTNNKWFFGSTKEARVLALIPSNDSSHGDIITDFHMFFEVFVCVSNDSVSTKHIKYYNHLNL